MINAFDSVYRLLTDTRLNDCTKTGFSTDDSQHGLDPENGEVILGLCSDFTNDTHACTIILCSLDLLEFLIDLKDLELKQKQI